MATIARPAPFDRRRFVSPALRSLMQRRAAEFTGFVPGGAGVCVPGALARYHAGDPSFDTASSVPVRNLAGPVGAAVADLLLQGFGLAGVLPGLALLAWAFRVAWRRGLGSPAARIAATLVAMPILGATLEAVPKLHGLTWPTLAGLGGAVGRLLAPAALAVGGGVMGAAGAALVWTIGAALSVTLVLLALGLSGGEWRTIWRVLARIMRFAMVARTPAIAPDDEVLGRSPVWRFLDPRKLIPMRLFRRRNAEAGAAPVPAGAVIARREPVPGGATDAARPAGQPAAGGAGLAVPAARSAQARAGAGGDRADGGGAGGECAPVGDRAVRLRGAGRDR